MGPTADTAAGEAAGARLLPVERLMDSEGGREAVEGEQRPRTAVQRPGRRVLGLRPDPLSGDPQERTNLPL